MITPESQIEKNIIEDAYFRDAILIGKKRGGHPEGCLGTHIENILAAVSLFPEKYRTVLRISAMLHDTGKFAEYGKAHLIPEGATEAEHQRLLFSSRNFQREFSDFQKDPYVPTHAAVSWLYAKRFTDNEEALNVIRYHDTAWRIHNKRGPDGLFKKYFEKSPELYVMFAYIDSINREKDTAIWLENKLVEKNMMQRVLSTLVGQGAR